MTTTNDPIADMLTRIRNANTSKHDTVDIPASKMKLSIADILVDEGYIAKYDLTGEGVNKNIHVTLKYGADKNEKIISGLKRISKPGLRIYADAENLPRVLGGLGIAIISTSQGVMTDKEARKRKIGGEVLLLDPIGGEGLVGRDAYTDLMIEFQRIGSVCSNVGIATMVRVYPELGDHEHLYYDRLHAGGDEAFDAACDRVHERYFSLLSGLSSARSEEAPAGEG